MIYLTRYVCSKSIKMLSPYYHELIEQIKNMKKKIFIGWNKIKKIIGI